MQNVPHDTDDDEEEVDYSLPLLYTDDGQYLHFKMPVS